MNKHLSFQALPSLNPIHLRHQWVFACLWMTRAMSQINTHTVRWMLQRFPFKLWCDYVSLYLIKAYLLTSSPEGFYVKGDSGSISILFDSREMTVCREISYITFCLKCLSHKNKLALIYLFITDIKYSSVFSTLLVLFFL